jgi:hypothetical protein
MLDRQKCISIFIVVLQSYTNLYRVMVIMVQVCYVKKCDGKKCSLQKCQAVNEVCTVGGQIKLGHLKFNLCKSDH